MVLSCLAFSCRPRPTQPKSYTVSEALTGKQACPNFSSVMQKQGIPVQLCEPCLHQKPSYVFPNHAKNLSHHYPHVFALGRYEHDPIALFFSSIALFSVLEYFTSFIMEKLFHARWWDYSYMHFNINGRICLETMIPFGLLGVVVVSVINPIVTGFLQAIPPIIAYIVFIILA